MPTYTPMVIKTFRWACLAALGVLTVLGPGGLRTAVAQTAEGAGAEVRRILAEMADLEQQLEEARRAQSEEETRLEQAGRSLESIESRLREREGLHEETKDFLERLDVRRQSRSRQLDADIERSRRAIDGSSEAVRQSMALLHGLEDSSQARPADLLTLALLLNTHYTRVQAESSRVLRLETERAELTESRALADAAARQHSIFTEYGLEQLQKRHKELAGQLASRRAESEAREEAVRDLTQRREQLQGLMAKLVEDESREQAGAPSPTPSPAPEIPVGAVAGGEANIDEPMISQTGPADGGPAESMSTEGARTLFWRAEPIGVCALASGEVAFAGPFAGYRHLLIISHGNGWRTLYGNMVSATVATGDTVAVGQRIGVYQAGAGQRAEPFWFEVRQGKEAVEPDGWSSLPTQWRQKLFMRLDGR